MIASAPPSLVEPGKANWALGDAKFAVDAGARLMVARVNPEETSGVLEVKVLDGTQRTGWLAEGDFTPIKPTASTEPTPTSERAVPSPPAPVKKRARRKPDFG